jgi:radical SAM superfamily enzyme YgiQ (UPF0313 family)
MSWGKETLLQQFETIDYGIAGEGEYAFSALVNGTDPSEIEGIVYRSGTAVHSGPERTTLCSMDSLPFPAYELFDGFPKRYSMPLFSYSRHPGANIISSRGCIYRCSYCDRSVFSNSFRWNSPEYTLEQISWLYRDFGVRHINFYDDLFTLNRKRVASLCDLLRKSSMKIGFNCIVRVGHIDKELIGLLKSAGCWMVNVGIESGDQAILDTHKGGLTTDKITEDVTRLHSAGLWVKGLFMMGFPGETEESIVRTRRFAQSLPLKDANITAFTPFPGAPIYSSIKGTGSFNEQWELMDCVHFIYVPQEIGSKETLERHYAAFVREFYQRPFMRKIYRKMLRESPHSYWRLLKGAPAFLRYARYINR